MKNNLVQKSLPKGWYKARIGSVGEVVSGATPKTANSNFWGGSLVWITPKDLSRLKTKYVFD